jgi:hypothetical protein
LVRDNGVAFDAKDCKSFGLVIPPGLSVTGEVFPHAPRWRSGYTGMGRPRPVMVAPNMEIPF